MKNQQESLKTLLSEFRKSKLYKYTHGQMLAVFAITWVIFAGGMFSVYNVGTLVGERMRLQNAADAAAFTGAVWEARTLNYIAYTNRTIIAQLSFIAYLTALCSCVKAWELICQFGEMIYIIQAIFAALHAVLTIIKNILEVILELPWELLLTGMGTLQTALETILSAKIPLAMRETAKSYDDKIKLNNGTFLLADEINAVNHYAYSLPASDDGAIRKKGKWEGLKKVLEATICDFTQGTFNGPIPLYNRTFRFCVPIFIGIRLVIGIQGNFDIQKTKMRAEDGPFIALQYYDLTELDWDNAYSAFWPAVNHETNINLDNIPYYVFDHKDNIAVGIYAVAQKSASDMSSQVFQKIGGLFGAPQNDLTAIAKACARYDDPNPSSGRASSLKGSDSDNDLGADNEESKNDDWSPNLFNPFWRAELVAVKAKKSEDYSKANSLILLADALGAGGLINEH